MPAPMPTTPTPKPTVEKVAARDIASMSLRAPSGQSVRSGQTSLRLERFDSAVAPKMAPAARPAAPTPKAT